MMFVLALSSGLIEHTAHSLRDDFNNNVSRFSPRYSFSPRLAQTVTSVYVPQVDVDVDSLRCVEKNVIGVLPVGLLQAGNTQAVPPTILLGGISSGFKSFHAFLKLAVFFFHIGVLLFKFVVSLREVFKLLIQPIEYTADNHRDKVGDLALEQILSDLCDLRLKRDVHEICYLLKLILRQGRLVHEQFPRVFRYRSQVWLLEGRLQ